MILIVFDALSASHLHHLGYERETTPAMDALAQDGTSFRQCISPVPYTVAAIPSIHTGRHPDQHGLTTSARRLPDEEQTIAEMLSAADYRCLGVVCNPNGGVALGVGQGFEHFQMVIDPEQVDALRTTEDFVDAKLGERALAMLEGWLAQISPGTPHFLYFHLMEPHTPYAPPEEFQRLWLDPSYDGPYRDGSSQLVKHSRANIPCEERDREAVRALYDANLRYGDHILGRMIERLKEAGLYDESLILVTADHGEAMWEHGLWGHNFPLYEEALRVPLIVKLPRGSQPVGRIVDELVSNMDVLPSLCEWLDLPLPSLPLEGRPLSLALDGGQVGALREIHLRSHHKIPHLGVRDASRKIILERDQQTGARLDVECYELDVDPAERFDRETLEGVDLERRLVELENLARRASAEGARRSTAETDGERNLLEMLGYTE